MTVDELRQAFIACLDGGFDPPDPGGGHTIDRLGALWSIGRDDLSLARLVEAHADAVAILHEAGREPTRGARYAVWASEAPAWRIEAERTPGGWCLHGAKRFCSGIGHVTHALVTAVTADGPQLFDLALDDNGAVEDAGAAIATDVSGWAPTAFAATGTGMIRVDGLDLPADAAVGGPNWYVERPGFWHGAIGVAACWAGGAAGLVEAGRRFARRDDGHALAHAGAMRADVWEMHAVLRQSATEIDLDPSDQAGAGRARALALRFVIERAASDVLRRFDASCGPAPRIVDPDITRRCDELQLYLLQSHAEHDLEALGRDGSRHGAVS